MEIQIPNAFVIRYCDECQTNHALIRPCQEIEVAKCRAHPNNDEPCTACNIQAVNKTDQNTHLEDDSDEDDNSNDD